MITTTDKLTISAMAGNSGAGGVMLALGSEYWTYCLPRRVGEDKALELTEQCLPISSNYALQIGLVDKLLDNKHVIFYAQVKNLTQLLIADNTSLQQKLREKSETRRIDESNKLLSLYRKEELKKMYVNFYGNDKYHKARHRFVFIISCKETPNNIALLRQKIGLWSKLWKS
jgi:putative two-component system hydrogenase maturation factor HypX/HoxX